MKWYRRAWHRGVRAFVVSLLACGSTVSEARQEAVQKPTVTAPPAQASGQANAPILSPTAMKADLAQIEAMLDEVHPNPFFRLKREVFRKKAEAIIHRYPQGATFKQFYVASAGLVAELGDGHTRVTPATPEYVTFRDGGGLLFPLELSLRDGKVSVTKNYGPGSPDIGTELRSVNGTPARSIIKEFVPLQSGERLIFREEEAGQNARGFGFTLFNWRPPYLVIDSQGRTFQLPGVPFGVIRGNKSDDASPNLSGCSFKIVKPSVGYLEFVSGYPPDKFKVFVENAFRSFQAAKIKSLIIDVRNNLGGGQEAGAMVIELFTDKPYRQFGGSDVKVSQMMKNKYGEQEFKMRFGTDAWSAKSGTVIPTQSEDTVPGPNPLRIQVPTYVLTSPLTFSNGMAFVSAVKDCHLATIVGEETGGLGSGYGQFETFDLKNSKLTLWVSVKHIFRPSRVDDGRGILPDIPVMVSSRDHASSRDPVFQKALELACSPD